MGNICKRANRVLPESESSSKLKKFQSKLSKFNHDRRDINELSQVFSRAFQEDPVFIHLVPKKDKRLEFVVRETSILAKDSNYFTIITKNPSEKSKIACVSLWRTSTKKASSASQWKQMSNTSRHYSRWYTKRFWNLMSEMEEAEKIEKEIMKDVKDGEYYFLEFIGTDTNSQGKGLGADNLQVMIKRMNEEKKCAFLVSVNKKNLGFYKRHGFKVMKEEKFLGVDGYYMRRDPIEVEEKKEV